LVFIILTLGVLLQPAGTATTNYGMYTYVTFRLFREKCSADRSWKFVLVGPEKSWKMIFLKEWSPCVKRVEVRFMQW